MNATACSWFAIVNPCSGAMRSRAFRERWIPMIDRAAAMALSEGARHATQLAAQARRYDGIVAVGGDGTALAVLAGIDHARQRLAILPAGRGNSLARDLGLARMQHALDALATGVATPIDLMELELQFAGGAAGRVLAASTIAIGYPVDVVQQAAALTRAGPQAYAMASLLVRPRDRQMQIAYGTDGFASRALTGVMIGNTRFAANFVAFPQASPRDGLLDVAELRRGWLPQTLHNLCVLARSSAIQPYRRVRTGMARLRLPAAAPVLVDGEIYDGVVAMQVACRRGGVLCQSPLRRC